MVLISNDGKPLFFPPTRLIRAGTSLAVVLAAYWAYALVAVPLIEPSIRLERSDNPSQADLAEITRLQSRRIEQLGDLFSAGSWELEHPNILESEQIKLLFREYTNLGDGKVELRPCTIVFVPGGGRANVPNQKSQAFVLQAPDGALLEFNEPVDLRRARIGRLVRGQLRGKITIRSGGRNPGPHGELLAHTRDIAMTEQEIFTPHAVEFRLGANYGRGSDMHIKFLPGEPAGAAARGPSIAGIELLQVNHLERLHLVLDGGLLPAGNKQTPDAQPASPRENHPYYRQQLAGAAPPPREAPAAKSAPQPACGVPVEVACRGPFRFHLIQQVATFQDQVDVLQIHADGPSDQLQCEYLAIYLARPRHPNTATSHKTASSAVPDRSGMLDLQPRRFEARGTPATIFAPSRDFQARGELLEYDLWSKRVLVSAGEEAFLRQGPNEIHAKSVQYQPARDGRLGQAAAQGPGWLRAQLDQHATRHLLAQWNDQLRLRPHEQQQVISLNGGAEVSLPGMGRLSAWEIHFWLAEGPAQQGTQRPAFRPDRMLARQDVRLDSAQLSGSVDELRVWFESAERPVSKPSIADRAISQLEAINRAAALARHFPGAPWMVQRTPNGSEGWTAAASGVNAGVGVNSGANVRSGAATGATPHVATATAQPGRVGPPQHFDVAGRLLQARVLLLAMQSELAELVLEGNVRFAQTPQGQGGQEPLAIRGEQVHVVDGSKPSALLTVIGSPAYVQTRGHALTGSNIHLNRGANLLWMEGPGQMTLPIDRDLQGQSLPAPEHLDVRWQGRMAFDGQTARFEESVTAATQNHQLQTHTLEVTFRQPIRFGQSNDQAGQQPEAICCRGGATVDTRTLDQKGLASLQRGAVNDLTINLLSGAASATGPGWISSVRRGSPDDLRKWRPGQSLPSNPETWPGKVANGSAPGTPTHPSTPATDPASPQVAEPEKLVHLQVRFQQAVSGNLRSREMVFRGGVRGVYGPVSSWEESLDPDQPDRLGPQAVLLKCDQLSLVDMPAPSADRRALELEATGNIVVQGQSFTARCARMSYAETKGLLVLEGDGRSDAELFRQEYVGGPRSQTSARKIYYWHRLDQVRVEGARWFEMNQFPQAQQPQAAKP